MQGLMRRHVELVVLVVFFGSLLDSPATPAQPAAAPEKAAPSPAQPPSDTGTQSAAKRSFRPPVPKANFSPPVLFIAEPDHDWGTVLQGEKVQHSYPVTNKGGMPLTITDVKPDCGCTVATKPEKPIESGQSDFIGLLIDTTRFTGSVHKGAKVYSNAVPSPTRISIGGKVEPFFVLDPPTPKMEIVRGVAPQPIKVSLRRTSKVELKVDAVKVPDDLLSASLKEGQPGDLYEITLAINKLPENPQRYYFKQVQMKLDANGKSFDVPMSVSVNVTDRIVVQPRPAIYFSPVETKALKEPNAQPISKTVDVKSLAGPDHTFKVTKIETEPQTVYSPSQKTAERPQESCFQTKIETVEAGRHYRLIVEMPKLPTDEKLRSVREKITLTTDDPMTKELVVQATASLPTAALPTTRPAGGLPPARPSPLAPTAPVTPTAPQPAR